MGRILLTALIVLLALISSDTADAQSPVVRTLTRAALEDKVRGGWVGQMLGVSFGAPTEFRHLGTRI